MDISQIFNVAQLANALALASLLTILASGLALIFGLRDAYLAKAAETGASEIAKEAIREHFARVFGRVAPLAISTWAPNFCACV